MKFKRTMTAALATLGFVAIAHAEDRVVNVYNWSDYIDNSVLEEFSKETGIKVVYDVFDSNETLENKLLAGGSGYDVVVPSAHFLQRQIQAGVFQKLDKSKLPNLSNMWDMISTRAAAYDPGNEYAIDYMWGTVGIGYNVKKVKEITGSDAAPTWATVFDPKNAEKFKACGIYMLDSPTDILPSALAYLGLDGNTKNFDEIQKAGDVVASVRPFVRKFHSSEYINALANGDICLAVGWSGDVFQARNRAKDAKAGVEVGYVIPDQGAEMWFDMMAIPADAQHVAEAHEFLNFIMKPEVAAKISNVVFYANGNKASQQFIDKAILEDKAIYPSDDVLKKLFTVTPYEQKTQRQVTRLWTKIVSGQ